jgi:hypothetical protein
MDVSGQLHTAPGKETLGAHCIGGWVGPRAGLDAGVWRIYLPLPGIVPQLSSP